jgi:hypothetical protein
MPSEQLHVIYDASSNFTSESWEVMPTYPGRPLRQGSLQAIWSGLDALTGTLELEVSNDNINWNCYGGVVEVTMTPAADNQIYEFQKFMSRYVRVKYTKNTVTTGTIKIVTHGATW